MNSKRLKLLTLSATILLATLLAQAANASDWSDEAKACEKALADAQNVVYEQGKEIWEYTDQTDLQKSIIAAKDQQLASPLRDPIKVAGATAVILTVLIVVTGHLK